MTMPNITGTIPTGGEPKPSLRSYKEGRLVLVFPLEEYTGHEFGKKDAPKQFMRCNVVALPDPQSAPFIDFGGKMNNLGQMTEPDTLRVQLGNTGWMCQNVSLGGGGMLYILRRMMRDGQAIVGRLWKDPEYNGAWKIKDATPQETELAQQWMAAYMAGQIVNPVPLPIPGVPQQRTAQPQGAPQQFGQQPAPAQPQPVQTGWGAMANPATQQQYGQGVSAPIPQPVFAAAAQPTWGAPQQPVQQPAFAAAAQQGWGAPAQPVQQYAPGDAMAAPTGY